MAPAIHLVLQLCLAIGYLWWSRWRIFEACCGDFCGATFLSADRLGGAAHSVLRRRLPRTCRFAWRARIVKAGRLTSTAVPAATGLPVTLTGSSSDSVLRALGSSAPAADNIGSRSHLATLSGSFHHGLVFRS